MLSMETIDWSAAEIAEQFEIPLERVEAILTYAKSHRVAHPA
jgi:uncharacterized protein (DUF433 family)